MLKEKKKKFTFRNNDKKSEIIFRSIKNYISDQEEYKDITEGLNYITNFDFSQSKEYQQKVYFEIALNLPNPKLAFNMTKNLMSSNKTFDEANSSKKIKRLDFQINRVINATEFASKVNKATKTKKSKSKNLILTY